MKTACYTDIHNQQAMLNYPTVLRKSAVIAAENTVAEFGKNGFICNRRRYHIRLSVLE